MKVVVGVLVVCLAASAVQASYLDQLEEVDMLKPSECRALKCVNGGMLDAENCKCVCPHPFKGRTCRTCARACANGGEIDSKTCQCKCESGFDGQTCHHKVGAPLPPVHAHSKKKLPPVPKMKLDEVALSTVANALEKVDATMGCTQAGAGEACNHFLYTICHGSKDADEDGTFVLEDTMKCTRWMLGSDALKILMHPMAGDLSDFIVVRNMIDAKGALNLPHQEEATTGGNQGAQISMGGRVGFTLCRVTENEEYNNPAAGENINVMESAHCSDVLKQEELAPRFVYLLTDDETENHTTDHDTAAMDEVPAKNNVVTGANAAPQFLNSFLAPKTMDMEELQSRTTEASKIMSEVRAKLGIKSKQSGDLFVFDEDTTA